MQRQHPNGDAKAIHLKRLFDLMNSPPQPPASGDADVQAKEKKISMSIARLQCSKRFAETIRKVEVLKGEKESASKVLAKALRRSGEKLPMKVPSRAKGKHLKALADQVLEKFTKLTSEKRNMEKKMKRRDETIRSCVVRAQKSDNVCERTVQRRAKKTSRNLNLACRGNKTAIAGVAEKALTACKMELSEEFFKRHGAVLKDKCCKHIRALTRKDPRLFLVWLMEGKVSWSAHDMLAKIGNKQCNPETHKLEIVRLADGKSLKVMPSRRELLAEWDKVKAAVADCAVPTSHLRWEDESKRERVVVESQAVNSFEGVTVDAKKMLEHDWEFHSSKLNFRCAHTHILTCAHALRVHNACM